MSSNKNNKQVDHYGASYSHFTSSLYEEIRRETYGEDIGQTGWLTAEEQDKFISWFELKPNSNILDVACGSGGPSLRLARLTKSHVHGIDAHEQGIANAKELAREHGLTEQTTFDVMDAGKPLSLPDSSYDAVVCIDAINHLPDRHGILSDWARLIKPGGRVLFTDPIVVTGPLSNEEIATRSSVGYFLFVPHGEDQRIIKEVGLELLVCEDVTDNMARIAKRWGAARASREKDLRKIEGDETFEGQQSFFRVAALIADERRLSRFIYVATKPE